ncbi:MAG: SpoIID/LytB domain-containing protein [Clostridiales bacterium]|jgi:stage II sporulation protein D|nr:SpoIID/LytB domain-containing protein [Clostridiales bacterium]
MKKIIFIMAIVFFSRLFPGSVLAQETIRVGLYYDAGLRTNAVLLSAEFINQQGLDVSLRLADPVVLPVTYTHASLMPVNQSAPLVQVGAGSTATDTLQLARETKSLGYKTYLVYRSDGTAFPYKVWVEGIEVAVKSAHYPSAVAVYPQGDLLLLNDNTQAEVGLIIDGRVALLLAPRGGVTRVGASGQFTRNYEGAFEFTVSGGRIAVVNTPGMEQYIFGVVPYEMYESWPVEALKAQAVAARSYAYVNQNKHRALGFGVCDSPACCQKYAGFNGDYVNTRRAVEETAGKLARYNGKVAQLYYHSNSGGHTENSEDVWSNPVPYVRATPDPYSVNDSLLIHLASRTGSSSQFPAKWLYTHSRQEVEDMLRNNIGVNIGTLLEIRSLNQSEGGRHLEILVRGTAGEYTLTRSQTRSAFNLPSSLYNIIQAQQRVHVVGAKGITKEVFVGEVFATTSNGAARAAHSSDSIVLSNGSRTRTVSKVASGFAFDGRGWGHGVGMSQWGAYEMAKQGHTYQEILTYYFRGISID